MENQTGAQGEDDSLPGDGATGDEGGDKKQDDPTRGGTFVPIIRMTEAVAKERERAARAEAELAALRQAQTKQAEKTETKRHTRAELNAFVANGSLTQDQADEIFAKQIEDKATEMVARKVAEEVAKATRGNRIESSLEEYKKLVPEIMQPGSELRVEIEKEYAELVALGQPNSEVTQLMAARAVLGPLDKLRLAKSGREVHVGYQETGGGGTGHSRSGSGKSLYDNLSPREKAHYDKLLAAGTYKSKAEINEELKFAASRRRAKA